MDTFANLLAVAVVVAVLAVVARVLWTLWRTTMNAAEPLLMDRMLARQGVAPARAEDTLLVEQLAHGMRRCAACREKEACAAWLDQKATAGYERFCPNAGLIESVRRQQAESVPRGALPAG